MLSTMAVEKETRLKQLHRWRDGWQGGDIFIIQ